MQEVLGSNPCTSTTSPASAWARRSFGNEGRRPPDRPLVTHPPTTRISRSDVSVGDTPHRLHIDNFIEEWEESFQWDDSRSEHINNRSARFPNGPTAERSILNAVLPYVDKRRTCAPRSKNQGAPQRCRRADDRGVKLPRAYGGCSGNPRRGRTWRATKRTGEPHAGHDPVISEWGNPCRFKPAHPCVESIPQGRAAGELKHLSTRTRRKQTRDPQ